MIKSGLRKTAANADLAVNEMIHAYVHCREDRPDEHELNIAD